MGSRKRWMQAGVLIIAGALAGCGAAAGEAGVTASLFGLFSKAVSEGGATVETGKKYGPLPRHRLDIYRPENDTRSGPVVIFYYGGGWTAGERDYYGFVGTALASRGYTTVIPDYRLFPDVKFPAFVEDAALSYAWVARNAAGGKCARPLIVMGHSAGAHIAALLALDGRYLDRLGGGIARPRALIGLAGPYAFDPTTWPTTKDIFSTVADPNQARPIAFVRRDAPPALLLHGSEDDIVKPVASRQMADALQKAGVSIEKIELEGVGHIGIIQAIAWPFRWMGPVLDQVLAFAAKQAASQPAAGCEGPAAAKS